MKELMKTSKVTIPDRFVQLEEQGLRDGLQTLPEVIPTEVKLRWIEQLEKAGVKRIQVGSFVHPKLVPQMADTDQLFNQIKKKEGIVYSALALNIKGVERALSCGVDHLAISLSASNTHSIKNSGMTLEEAKVSLAKMVVKAKSGGVVVRAGIQCAFGCRFEGIVDPRVVKDLTKFILDLGVDELALADSTGMADPVTMTYMLEDILIEAFGVPVIMHLHNTENKGLANVYAAVKAGVRLFDTAFGGLGGCPFIKGATGNIATEDTIHMLRQMGYDTGVDIIAVSKISLEIESMLGHQLPGAMHHIINQ
jgi:hydroxymethylglutaryl-CoA lyase